MMKKTSTSSSRAAHSKYYDMGTYHGGKAVKTTVNGNLNIPRINKGGDMAFKGTRKGHSKNSRSKTPMVY